MYSLFTLPFNLGKVDICLIPCPFKYLTSLDCPGCGFQRAVIALLQGNFVESIHLYPPTIPFLLSVLIGSFSYIFNWNKNSNWLKFIYVAAGFVMMINYGYKIATHQLH